MNNFKVILHVITIWGISMLFLLIIDVKKSFDKFKLEIIPLTVNKLDNDDINLLSDLITTECGNCNIKFKLLIGSTVLNRARINNKSITQVILEKNQYVFYKHDIDNHYLAKYLLTIGPIDNTITHFHNKYLGTKKLVVKYKNKDIFIGHEK